MPRSLGPFLRELRCRRRFGLRELARRIAVPPSSLAAIEQDRQGCSDEQRLALANELGADPLQLEAMDIFARRRRVFAVAIDVIYCLQAQTVEGVELARQLAAWAFSGGPRPALDARLEAIAEHMGDR